MPIIVEKLTHAYLHSGDYKAVSDISLTIREGEFLGIIGQTGSGKSTFIQHLNGLMQPTEGKVYVDGFDMSDKKQRREGRRLVGMVFQYPEYQLFEETVQKDVAFGCLNMGMSESEALARADEAMSLVGLSPEKFGEKSPFELSGGEKRRAALAGIISMRPKYLIMDEPMAGLDPLGRKDIMDTIDSLRRELGCAVVMVSHSMDDVALRSERIAVLSEGRLIREGDKREIFSDVELLLKNGLDIPQVTRLALALKKRGVNMPDGILDMDGFVKAIKERLAQ